MIIGGCVGSTSLSSNVNQVLITGASITPVTDSSFNVSATIDTKDSDALVSIEYGLTTDYGFETEAIPVNGVVDVTLLLNL